MDPFTLARPVATRRMFLGGMAAMGCAALPVNRLWAAMKYDRNGVLDLFRLRRDDTDARVKAGIEANRKGSLLFSFVDAAGKPLEHVHVKLRQVSHDFKYGANLFMLGEFKSAELNKAYEELFAGAFNLATIPFYWTGTEPERGKTRYARNSPPLYRRPPPDLCLEWCEAHGIMPKAHILNYGAVTPEWAIGEIYSEKVLLEKRYRELAERYADRIKMWEVTNETLWGKPYSKSPTTSNFYAADDFVEWSFKLAEKHFPANELIINEAHCRIWNTPWFNRNRSPYYMQIERAIAKGARVDAVGLQFHMFHACEDAVEQSREFYDPERLFDVMDTYAKFGLPLQITELTIPAYSTDPGDEAVQAEILRELYRIWFSQRGMEAIIYWNVPDGYAAYSEPGDFSKGENKYYGGLCRFDMTPKPAYKVIKDLFEREWRSDAEADVSGRWVFRGFYGTYDAEFTSKGRTVSKRIHVGRDELPHLAVEI